MSDAKKEPTAAEAMLFFSIVKHTRNKADVDWDSVALEAGFKNADVAKVSTLLALPTIDHHPLLSSWTTSLDIAY
jgi:hypothetical protein